MAEGFDPRKSQIGQKAMVAFIDAEVESDLKKVFFTCLNYNL